MRKKLTFGKRKRKTSGSTGSALMRFDPSRTLPLRRSLSRYYAIRFEILKREVAEYIQRGELQGLLTNADQGRDKLGRWASVGAGIKGAGKVTLEKLKKVGASAKHYEHVAKDWVVSGVSSRVEKLPKSVQKAVKGGYFVAKLGVKAAFSTWVLGQKLAEEVAKAKGSTPEEAAKLKGVLMGADIAALKPVQIGLAASGAGMATLGIASFIPPATAAYLMYSTARNPMATARAAKTMVRSAIVAGGKGVKKAKKYIGTKLTGNVALTPPSWGVDPLVEPSAVLGEIADYLKGNNDWGYAILLHSLDAMPDDVTGAITLSTSLLKEYPNDPSSPQEDDEVSLTTNSLWSLLSGFGDWMREKIKQLFGSDTAIKEHVDKALSNGVSRGYGEVKRKLPPTQNPSIGRAPTNPELIQEVLRSPEVETVRDQLGTRINNDIGGILEKTVVDVTRKIIDGVEKGSPAKDVVKDTNDAIDDTKEKTTVIIQDGMVRSNADAQLIIFEKLGIPYVNAAVEWTITPDKKVCPKCKAMEGVVLTIKEAKGLIPRHYRCRCAWIPALVGEASTKQKITKESIEEAIEQSRSGEKKKGWGNVKIGEERPEPLGNSLLSRLFKRDKAGQFSSTEGGGGGTAKAPKVEAQKMEISIKDTKTVKVADRIKSLFGKDIPPESIAKLCGAGGPADGGKAAKVTIHPVDDNKTPELLVEVDHPDYKLVRYISKVNGKPVLLNESMIVHNKEKKTGTKLLKHQIESSEKVGVETMLTHSIAGKGTQYIGYYVWPRLGYDCKLTDKIKSSLPTSLGTPEKISDVMKTKEGREWWKENGVSLPDTSFDTRKGSPNRRIFDAYAKEAGI